MYRLVILLVILAFFLAACEAAPRLGQGEKRTGGVTLSLFVEDEGDRTSYYRVFADGTLGYSGGLEARRAKIEWTGTMTDEDIEELHRRLDDRGWLRGVVEGARRAHDANAWPRFRISIETPERRQTVRLRGRDENILPIYDHLRSISLRRFDHILDTLPRPAQQGAP